MTGDLEIYVFIEYEVFTKEAHLFDLCWAGLQITVLRDEHKFSNRFHSPACLKQQLSKFHGSHELQCKKPVQNKR